FPSEYRLQGFVHLSWRLYRRQGYPMRLSWPSSMARYIGLAGLSLDVVATRFGIAAHLTDLPS
ncbi:hypothetical protein ACC668_37305, partial [Rhizobium ruizarguesonis]